MAEGSALAAGTTVTLHAADVMGSATEMTLWPASVFASMRPGDLVHVDFDGALLQVMDVSADHAHASAVVLNGGRVKSNRAVVMDPPPSLGPMALRIATDGKLSIRSLDNQRLKARMSSRTLPRYCSAFFTTSLNMANIGNGRVFLSSPVLNAVESAYVAPTLGAGLADQFQLFFTRCRAPRASRMSRPPAAAALRINAYSPTGPLSSPAVRG